MLEYIAVNNYKLEDMNIERIEKLDKQDIKTKLLPTLKDRNPQKSNINEMKKVVKEYLKDILLIDDNIKQFYYEFQIGNYKPELLFDDKKILDKIKEHPMIVWKLSNK